MKRLARIDRSGGALLLSAAGTYLGFLLFYRYYIPQGDDVRFTAQSRHPFGAFTSDLWFHFWNVDYHTISGRTATVLGMLMMRPGVRFFRLLAPLVCAWLVLAAAGLLRGRGERGGRLVTGLAAASVLPITLVTDQSLNGDVLAWCMSFANYVLPTASLMTVVLVLVRRADGAGEPRTSGVRGDADAIDAGSHNGAASGSVGWPLAAAGVLLALLAPTMHEDTALGMVSLVVVCLVVLRRRLGALGWTILVLGLIGAAEMLSAPGLRAHLNYSNGAVLSGESGLFLRAHRLANGCSVMLATTWVALLGLTIALAIMTRRIGTAGSRPARVLPALAVACAVTMLVAWRLWIPASRHAQGYAVRLTAGGKAAMMVLIALVAVVVVSLLLMAWRLRSMMGAQLLVVLVTGLGCSAPAVVSGVSTPRAYMQGALWLTVTAWLAVLAAAGPRATRFRAAVCLACVLLCGWWLVTSVAAMRANLHAWRPVAHELALARHAHRQTRVAIPLLLPQSAYQFDHGFDLKIYRNGFHTWYGLPRQAELVQAP